MRVISHLRTIRIDANLTLSEVEELTGVSKATLSKIETGRELPADKYLDDLARAYGEPAGWYDAPLLLLIQADKDGDE